MAGSTFKDKMPTDLNSIKTIIVVMMENRSFDHLLGYLSMAPYNWPNVEGLRDDPAWKARVSSLYNGSSFQIGRAHV